MSLFLATLISGILLILLGGGLLSGRKTIIASLKAFPRSATATLFLFGGGAAWFLFRVWHLTPADFGNYRTILFIAFGAIAVLSFKYVPDFLAVRGSAILVLLGASPLLDAAYMEYDQPQRLLMVGLVYLAIAFSIYFGSAPYRMRDFFEWLFRNASRPKLFGACLLGYGALLTITAFTY